MFLNKKSASRSGDPAGLGGGLDSFAWVVSRFTFLSNATPLLSRDTKDLAHSAIGDGELLTRRRVRRLRQIA